jgi:UDP-N-acetyl-D-galactosamine dehydrogenase
MKVTSGSTPEAADLVDGLYRRIISAGTHRPPASAWRKREGHREHPARRQHRADQRAGAAFHQLDIDTHEVLQAAGTNGISCRSGPAWWRPLHRRRSVLPHPQGQQIGYHTGHDPGRAPHQRQHGRPCRPTRDQADATTQNQPRKAKVLILGLAFKENCPDLRNTAWSTSCASCASFNVEVDVHDPWVSAPMALAEYGWHWCPSRSPADTMR